MKHLEGLVLYPRKNVTLRVYAHEPGEEVWFHFAWFPEPLAAATFNAEHYLMDYMVKKVVNLREDETCASDSNMLIYGDCIRKQFAKFYSGNGNIPNCDLPWVRDMLGQQNYTGDKKPCSLKEANRMNEEYQHFIIAAARFDLPECPVPCQRVRFELQVEKYDRFNNIPFQQGYSVDPDTGEKSIKKGIYVFYGTSDTAINSQTLIVSLSQFISSIGGGLGLFLGFSCINLLFYLIDKCQKACKKDRKTYIKSLPKSSAAEVKQ